MGYISPEGLQVLKEYKYKSGLSGYIDRVIMTPFWEWAVTLLPFWLAPNLITVWSLSHGVMAFILLVFYSPDLESEIPQWVFPVVIYCLFMYQTLDAVDGKQARRTGCSSPLGQLFDHGCDAQCCYMMGIFVNTIIRAGSTWASYMVFCLHIVPFFAVNWEETQTHVFRFGLIGVTEGQFLIMFVALLPAIFGSDFWAFSIFGLPLYCVPLIVACFAVPYTVVDSYAHASAHWKKEKIDPSEGQASFFLFLFFMGLATTWIYFSTASIYLTHCVLTLSTIGLVFCYLVTRLIVCSVTRTHYSHFHKILFPFPFVVLNAAFKHFYGIQVMPELLVLYAYFLFAVVLYCHYVHSVITEITTFLGIECFRIVPKLPQKQQ